MIKKIVIIILGLIFGIVLLEIVMFISSYINSIPLKNKGKAELRILCLGESMTVGRRGDYSWPSQLESILSEENKINVEVVNRGIAEVDSSRIVESLVYDLKKFCPDLVIIMTGINDSGIEYYRNYPFYSRFLFKYSKLYKLFFIFIKNIYADIPEKKIVKINNKLKYGRNLDEMYFQLAKEYLKLFQVEKVEEYLKKSIEVNNHNLKSYIFLGALYSQMNNNEALELLINAKNMFPQEKQIYFLLSENYIALGDLNKAEGELKQYLEINPKSEKAKVRLGQIYMLNNKFDSAQKYIVEALKSRSNHYLVDIEIGKFYKIIGKYDIAKVYFEKVLKADKNNEIAKNYLEELNDQSGNYINPKTKDNYLKIKKILDDYKIPLVCMQYPMRSIKPLKNIFLNSSSEVFFVDNEYVFKDAVKVNGADKYFVDLFAGDFGHCTKEGNRLIAENTSKILLKYLK